jgi:biopolymer transport protein ExbD
MANIDTGVSAGARRSVTHDVPLIPYIDFLLCLISFLLITAVWSQMARLEANASVAGDPRGTSPPPQKTLHLALKSGRFELSWKQGETVIERHDVARRARTDAAGSLRFPELAQRLQVEWQAHVPRSGQQRVSAVLHAPNDVPFEELAAVMDALSGPRLSDGVSAAQAPGAFSVSLAMN